MISSGFASGVIVGILEGILTGAWLVLGVADNFGTLISTLSPDDIITVESPVLGAYCFYFFSSSILFLSYSAYNVSYF